MATQKEYDAMMADKENLIQQNNESIALKNQLI